MNVLARLVLRRRVRLDLGHTQCPHGYRYPRSDTVLSCALRAGHVGKHEDAYDESPLGGRLRWSDGDPRDELTRHGRLG